MIEINNEKLPIRVYTDPFKIWVIDDYLVSDYAESLAVMFPRASDNWYKYDNVFEKKRALDDLSLMPKEMAWRLAIMNTHIFVDYLEKLTGIEGIVPDPSFRGGGLHQISRGGKLDIHCDFNFHKHLKLDRRLNVLLYLNLEWKKEWGGYLECWDSQMIECKVKVLPIMNRMVIFETTDTSFHGHPEELKCPNNVTRNSMAWYFYSNGRPFDERSLPHSTKFQKLPGEETNKEIERLRELRNQGRLK